MDDRYWGLLTPLQFCPKCATSLLSRMPNGPPRLKLLLNVSCGNDLAYVIVSLTRTDRLELCRMSTWIRWNEESKLCRQVQLGEEQKVTVNSIFNSKIGAEYLPPEHKGEIPPNVEGGQLYTGSCHCGAVTVALSCKPLDEFNEGVVIVCNCSICSRVSCALQCASLTIHLLMILNCNSRTDMSGSPPGPKT